MIEQALQQIGLTQNEIKVYLALLDLGESKTGEILKKSNLNSGKIYEILNSLQKKGLISIIEKDNVKYFSPSNPKRVLDYLEEKKEEIDKQEKDYNKVLPELLKKVSSIKPPSKIEIFTGIKGMKTAYSKEFEYKDTVYILGVMSSKHYTKRVYDYFEKYHRKKREKLGCKVKKLYSEEARKDKTFHEKNSEIRYLPYASMVSISFVGNLSTIGIFTEELIFISIESKEVAENFKKQFDLLWKVSRK